MLPQSQALEVPVVDTPGQARNGLGRNAGCQHCRGETPGNASPESVTGPVRDIRQEVHIGCICIGQKEKALDAVLREKSKTPS